MKIISLEDLEKELDGIKKSQKENLRNIQTARKEFRNLLSEKESIKEKLEVIMEQIEIFKQTNKRR